MIYPEIGKNIPDIKTMELITKGEKSPDMVTIGLRS